MIKSKKIAEFASARTALKYGLMLIGVKPGSVILIPDYLCNVVWYPLLQLGLKVNTYPVLDNMSPNWFLLEEIQRREPAWALLMTHYFGQPQNIKQFQDFCSRHNLLLVEDNAHGYGGSLAGKPLGSFGHIGISSPRKILGTPSGGTLYGVSILPSGLNQNMKSFPAYLPVPLIRTALHSMPKVRRIVKRWAYKGNNWDNPRLYRESVQPDYGIDWFSHWRIASTDWKAIAVRRRGAWLAWAQFVQRKGLRSVFSEVHPESCPWAMPAFTSDLGERNSWLEWGAMKGLSLFPWPTLPDDVILLEGAALARWRTLVCFPLDSTPSELGL